MRGKIILSVTIVLSFVALTAALADVPRLITYQGRLTDEFSDPLPDDFYEMAFYLYTDSLTGDPIWEETQTVKLIDGLFNVRLGQIVSLPTEFFGGRWLLFLGMKLAEEEQEFQPRIRLTSSAFAIRALLADTADFASAGGGWVDAGAVVRLVNGNDYVGIGPTVPSEPLVVGKDLGEQNGDFIVIGNDTPDRWSGLKMGEDADNYGSFIWFNNEDVLALMTRESGVNQKAVYLKGGKVGIGTATPNESLVIGKDFGSYSGELIVVGNDLAGRYSGMKFGEDGYNNGNILWSNDNDYMYLFTMESGTSQTPVIIKGGRLSIGHSSPFATITAKTAGTAIHGENEGSTGGAGVLGKSSNPLGQGVKGMAMAEDGKGLLGQAYGTSGHAVHATASGSSGIGLYAEATASNGVAIEAHGGSSGRAAKFYGNVALYSLADDGLILELGEGLDYAEGFDVSDPVELEPGTVVCIDPDNPGRLKASHAAYDTKVAGIVAGANGLGSGVRLGAGGFDLDVALAGRVYCNVEATKTAIEPGDLLTTSATPGYAMKATEYNRAQGAILGKAMEPLAKGQTGQILVLVTLQ